MKKRFSFTVWLRELHGVKPTTEVTLLAKNPNDAKKTAERMFPALRVSDLAAVDNGSDTPGGGM